MTAIPTNCNSHNAGHDKPLIIVLQTAKIRTLHNYLLTLNKEVCFNRQVYTFNVSGVLASMEVDLKEQHHYSSGFVKPYSVGSLIETESDILTFLPQPYKSNDLYF